MCRSSAADVVATRWRCGVNEIRTAVKATSHRGKISIAEVRTLEEESRVLLDTEVATRCQELMVCRNAVKRHINNFADGGRSNNIADL